MIRQLHLVLIDVPLRRPASSLGNVFPRSLMYCLQKGVVQLQENVTDAVQSLHPWQRNVIQTLPIELRVAGLAAAALQWRGEGGVLRAGTWLQVQLVHMMAGLNDVHIALPERTQQNTADETELLQALQPSLSLSGFELHQSQSGNWYVWCEKNLNVVTRPIRSAILTNDYEIMPTGSDAQALRRLMTEIQMLLHQHPVNQRREQSGLPACNTLWFSGAGSLVTVATGTLQRIMSNEAYVQGLCDQINCTCWPVPRNANELLKLRDDEMVLVMDGTDIDGLAQDWVGPLLGALTAGGINYLDIYIDQLRISLRGGRRAQIQRWLSRSNSLTELLP